jgi:hypothetical protein
MSTSSIKAFFRISLLFVLPTLLVCLVMLELGLRATGRLPSNVTDGIFEQHGTTYRLRKNITKVSRTPSFTCTIDTNSYGLRDRAPGPRKLGPAPYFAFLGDSITFGNGVDYDDSFVGVFGRLAEKRGIDVINLAIGGHRFSEQADLLHDFMSSAPQQPSRVVIVFTKEFITGYERDLSGMFIKNGYIFVKDNWIIPYLTVTLGNASSSYCFFRDGIRKLQGRVSPPGSRAALEELEAYSKKNPWTDPAVAGRFEARLAKLDEEIRRSGATPVYVYMPVSRDLRSDELLAQTGMDPGSYDFLLYYKILERHSDKTGIQLVNLLPILQRYAAGEKVSFMQDPHYNAGANRVIGQALYDAILGSATPPTLSGR